MRISSLIVILPPRLNEGTGNKSRSLPVWVHPPAPTASPASTKGPGTNPGHLVANHHSRPPSHASTKGPGTNPGHPCTAALPMCMKSRLNEGTGNKSRSRVLDDVVTKVPQFASTKGPGTNPGHIIFTFLLPFFVGPQRRDREQIPVTAIIRKAPPALKMASTKGPGTNPGHAERDH